MTVTNPGGADAYRNGQRIPFAFGAITYTKPGKYQYVITEQGGGKPGMQYSGARYIATVTVTDNGDGTMSAAAVLTNTFGDDGVHIDGEPEEASADFTNTFVGENESVATIRGIKHYTDHTGTKPNNVVGTFNVMITPDKGNPANGPTFKSDVPVGVDGTWTRELQFTNEALNGQHEQTFTYHVREIVPEDVDSDKPTKDGMTYDVNTYDVQITVSRDANQNLITTVAYPDGGERVELTNSYRAQNTDAQALGVTKAVTGRDAEAGKFTFNATLRTNNAQYVKVEQPDGTLKDWATASVPTPAIAKGKSADIDFGSLVFTMPGTYTFAVREQLPDGASTANPKVNGWTYDTHTHTVTYTVTDSNGKLKAAATTDGSATFTNAYTAQVNYGADGAMRIGKTLTGRSMNAQEFSFTITPIDGAPMPNGAQSVTTANPFSAVSGQELVWPAPGTLLADLRFTQDDAGKTYRYTIREVLPEGVTEDAPTKNGVTYDLAEHTVSITVIDNGNGTLKTETTVDGQADGVARFANTYTIAKGESAVGFAKAITGRDWKSGESFTFELTPNAGQSSVPESVLTAAMPKSTSVTVGEPDSGRAAFAFNGFTFDQPGTYVYNVREQGAGESKDGLTNDARTALVSFTVVDKGDGTYSIGRLITGIDFEDGVNTFTNAYKAKEFTGVPTGMAFSKELKGTEWTADRAFDFTLEAVTDGAPMPEQATISVGKPAKGNKADFAFGSITYGKTGVYEYVVKEVQGDMPGVSYDAHSARVTVTVTDDGNGQLKAEAVVSEGAFSNTYTAKPFEGVPAGLELSKQLTGIAWPADRAFEFTLEGKDGAPMPAEAKATVGKPAEGDTAVFNFGAIRYEKAGEYEYTVKETKGDMPGVSYDGHSATVKVTVSDNGKGQLEATAAVTDGAFVNIYGAEPSGGVPEGMTFIKQLTGIDWPSDRAFEFTLAAEGNAPMPQGAKDGKLNVTVGKPADGNAAAFDFGAITYTTEGKYKYTVTEVAGDMPGVAYAKNTAKVTVTVKDDKQGKLIATAAVEGNVFANEYSAKEFTGVPTGMAFSKELTGIDWPQDRTFEFTLEAVTKDAPMPAEAKVSVGKPSKGAKADFGFGDITFTKTGTYEYTVKEAKGDMPGVSYDTHSAKVKVTVTDNGQGQLDATAKVAEGKFVNTYSAVPATGVPTDFTLTKRVEGMEWNADQKFEFTIQAQGGAPMPKNATTTVGKPANGDSATFDFGEIVFDRAGVYRYTVTETAGTQPGMVYDGHTATITVDVADDGQGHLVTATTVVNGLFTNTYSTQTVAYPGVDVTEDLTGRAQAQGEFQFVVSGSADDMARAGYTTRAVTSTPYEFAAAASGETVTVPGLFTGLELTHSDVCAGKRFVYEVDQTGAQSGNGLTVDDQVYRVEIWATDNGDGTMRVHTSINGVESTDPTPVLPFHNVYATAPVTIGGDAQVRINARKTLHGRALADGEFRFVVRDAKGAQLAGGTNAASGVVNFDAIEFTDARLISDVQAGIATAHVDGTRTVYRYEVTVSELTDALPAGITALESGFAATLVITDNGQGKLEAAVEYPADADGTLGFVNQYGAASEVSLGLNGNKVLAVASGNNAPDITGKYTFTLSGSQGAPMPQKTTAVNDAAGAVDFGQITYTMANVFGEQEAKPEEPKADENADGSDDASDAKADDVTTREKTFTYTVTESGSVAGVANDASAQRTITVHVKDNGDGTLTVSKESAASGTDFTFTNTYGVRPTDPTSPTDTSVKGGVPLTKTLSGRDLKAGEFTFELIEAASGKVVGSAANAADGSVSLPGVVFEAPGSYAYLVRELAGTTGGVTYDSRVYAAVATVVDNGDGTLGVSWAVTEPSVGPVEAMVFENTYDAQPTSVQISASKMLLGRDLAAGEFQFALTALDSAPMPEGATDGVQTVANDEHGNAQFGVIDYAQAGEYHYTVSEIKGDAEGVTYDETEHAVVVRVTDDGEGQLLAAVEYGDGEQGVVFTNTYTKPAEPDTPDTPDQPKPNMPAPSTPAAPQYPASGTPTYRPYTGTVAYTGADVALIVAVAAVLLAAGAALLTMARRRQ